VKDGALVAVLLGIGAHDSYTWTARPLLRADREANAAPAGQRPRSRPDRLAGVH